LNLELVSAILKEGTSVGTRLGSNLAWYGNIICKSDGNQVHLALIRQYLENVLSSGTSISLKHMNEYFVYLFEGIVCDISAHYPGYITVRITNAEEIINTRLSPRYDVYIAADLRYDRDDTANFSVVTDISFGGLSFVCNHKFDCDDELEVTIYLPSKKIVHAKGKIIKKTAKNNLIDYSMQFVELNENNCSLLSQYFTFLEMEISSMYKQYLTDSLSINF